LFLYKVHAQDDDEPGTGNSNVTYTMNTNWGTMHTYFQVDIAGEVTVLDILESGTEYTFYVRACDNPVPPDTRYALHVNMR